MDPHGIRYSCLGEREQHLYRELQDAILSRSFDFTATSDIRNIREVYTALISDRPEFVFVNHRWTSDIPSLFRPGGRISLGLCCKPHQVNKMCESLEAAVSKVTAEILSYGPMTDYDRLILIYEYLQDHVTYDDAEREHTGDTPLHFHSHTAYGALLNGTAVCDGFAAALTLLAQRLGIECTSVHGSSTARGRQENNHAWNLVYSGNRYHHLDATWEVPWMQDHGVYAYEYFCIDDATAGIDHQWDLQTVPPAEGRSLSYYRHNGLYANSMSDVETIFRRLLKTKQRIIRMRLADGITIPADDQQDYLGTLLQKIKYELHDGRDYRYGWDPETRCFFAQLEG